MNNSISPVFNSPLGQRAKKGENKNEGEIFSVYSI